MVENKYKKGGSWRIGYQQGCEEERKRIKRALLEIADKGEYEDMRREVESYLKD